MEHTSVESTQSPRGFATITKYFRKYRGYLVWGGLAVVAANVLILITPAITGRIVDLLQQDAPIEEIRNYVLLTIGLAVVSGIFRFTTRRTIIWMSRYLEYDLRGELFGHLLKLNPSFYHQSRTGDIMARMTNDLEAVRQLAGPAIMYTANAVVNLTVGFAFMIYLSPKLTLFALLPLTIMPIAVNRVGNRMHRQQARIQEHFAALTTAAQENLAGIRVIKAFRQEDAEVKHFTGLSHRYIGLNMKLARLQGFFIPLMRLVAAVSYLTVLYVGGRSVIAGDMGLGTVIAFFGYLGMMHWPVIAVGWVLSLYQRGKASLERINKLLQIEPAVGDQTPDLRRDDMKGHIEFRNLHFAYNGHSVLDGINLTIEAGQTIGLIGLTGSGKTTLVSLLSRLHPVNRGQLFIDGTDINDWRLAALRRRIGFATQEPFLFSDTVKGNIAFGRQDSSDAEVSRVSDIAALSKDIADFPDGFDTVVGERGITLSGGQKQRTAIARAVLVDPAILILDDATSAVDTETEHEIQHGIKRVLEGRTSIIISHRVSSVKEADFVVCLDGGRIVERGSHDELLRLNGFYAELYRSQLLETELERQ